MEERGDSILMVVGSKPTQTGWNDVRKDAFREKGSVESLSPSATSPRPTPRQQSGALA